MAGREKRPLGELFGLTNFGVNLTRLSPGSQSALMHAHKRQDEFVFILEGKPNLVTESSKSRLKPGDCAGFPAGDEAHHLINDTASDVLFLEIGDRTEGDEAVYPADDIQARQDPAGAWIFTRKDGTPY